VLLETVAASMGSLKVALTGVLKATSWAPRAGVVEVTVGASMSGAGQPTSCSAQPIAGAHISRTKAARRLVRRNDARFLRSSERLGFVPGAPSLVTRSACEEPVIELVFIMCPLFVAVVTVKRASLRSVGAQVRAAPRDAPRNDGHRISIEEGFWVRPALEKKQSRLCLIASARGFALRWWSRGGGELEEAWGCTCP